MKDISFLTERKIAHRGIFDNKKVYENTIDAFKLALKYNYIIELDLRMLSDGSIVCYHDENIDRLLNVDMKIEKMTYEELSYISKFEIPLFIDVLKLIDGKVPILVELKSKTRKHSLESKVALLLDAYKGLYAIQSFNNKSIKWFRKYKKNVPAGLLVCKKNYQKEFSLKKYDFINVNILLYPDKKIRKLREDTLVIGYKILTLKEYEMCKDVYDNLVCDNLLEIDGIK